MVHTRKDTSRIGSIHLCCNTRGSECICRDVDISMICAMFYGAGTLQPTRYFTITGQKLPGRPSAPGIYIAVKGNEATRILLH